MSSILCNPWLKEMLAKWIHITCSGFVLWGHRHTDSPFCFILFLRSKKETGEGEEWGRGSWRGRQKPVFDNLILPSTYQHFWHNLLAIPSNHSNMWKEITQDSESREGQGLVRTIGRWLTATMNAMFSNLGSTKMWWLKHGSLFCKNKQTNKQILVS